ncbi:hypothetical protein [Aurantimonas sp. 22II-16-19i]|uniref:hypothetical protein n=1 Tax=Aurantimonas sp. 22II-16-19i TaxID=1317114 RepID=UPI0009FB6722|nr:hypothetical protein [Aurantimonas sp. 22II-16-19i]
MSRRTVCGLIALSVAAAVAGFAAPAGESHPLIVRVVTIGGETGPAYYSLVEQGYRFLGREPSADRMMADAGSPSEPGGPSMKTLETASH